MAPRVVFFGTPEFARVILSQMIQSGWSVPLVITQPDRPAGRSDMPRPSPVTELAASHGIDTLKPEKLDGLESKIKTIKPEVLVVAAYGGILPPELLKIAPHGAVNVHTSLLPAYRGASPIQHAILDDAPRTGVTLMKMDQGLDTGPIISFARINILPDNTAGQLDSKLADMGASLIIETLPDYLAGSVTVRSQGESPVPVTRQLTKADGRIDWTKPASYQERFVRAMNPWPGAWTELYGQPLTIIQAAVSNQKLPPGEFSGEAPLRVGTGQGSLEIKRLKVAGKNETPGADWLRGYRGEARRFS